MQQMPSLGPQTKPLGGLYGFVRDHLAVVNGIVMASTTTVGVLDFLAPRVSIFPTVIYSITAALVLLMVTAAVIPRFVSKAIARFGLAETRLSSVPLWRSPAWQFAVTILLGVTIVGFASVAKASQGGLIASQFPAAKGLQETLLSLQRSTADIKVGVEQANVKLDVIVEAVDPANPADRCTDITCAVSEGASAKALRKLFERGVKLPPHPILRGQVLLDLGQSGRPNRTQVLDVLVANGLDPNAIFNFYVLDPSSTTPAAGKLAQDALRLSNYADNPKFRFPPPTGDPSADAWSDLAHCLSASSGGVTLVELAAMRGDKALYEHLITIGAKRPARPLVCKWSYPGRRGGSSTITFSNELATAVPG